jgi:hypothetical protein
VMTKFILALLSCKVLGNFLPWDSFDKCGRMDECNQATAATTEYLKANPFPKKTSDDSIFKFRWNKSMYQYYGENPEKGRRFAAGQEGVSKCVFFLTHPDL